MTRLFTCLGFIFSILAATAATAAERAIIVLDGSGSMWAQIDGVARITIARDTLESVLEDISPDLELGLVTYGHRERGNCEDIELLVPPEAGTASQVLFAAQSINPKGMTPISDAVTLAADELRYTEQRATVVLITDGLETCEADPCAVAAALESAGIDLTVHVVGFGLSDAEGQQVACLAENTGGLYIAADDGDALLAALNETVGQLADAEPVAEPEPEPEPVADEPAATEPEVTFDPTISLSEGGDDLPDDFDITWEVRMAGTDEYVTNDYYAGWQGRLPAGDYIISARADYATVEQPVTIVGGEVARPHFTLNAGRLIIGAYANAGEDVDDDASIYFEFPGGGSTTEYGSADIYVPAGTTTATVKLGSGSAVESIEVAAGETVTRDVVVGVGRVQINAEYAAELKVEEGDLFVEVLVAKKALDGSRETLDYGYGPDNAFDLPPGDYIARARLGEATVETPFTVVAGEFSDVVVPLEAGVLYVSAPGAYSFEILSPKKDIQGKRRSITSTYGEEINITLPAGDYVVAIDYGDGAEAKELEATVTAGERTELEAP